MCLQTIFRFQTVSLLQIEKLILRYELLNWFYTRVDAEVIKTYKMTIHFTCIETEEKCFELPFRKNSKF